MRKNFYDSTLILFPEYDIVYARARNTVARLRTHSQPSRNESKQIMRDYNVNGDSHPGELSRVCTSARAKKLGAGISSSFIIAGHRGKAAGGEVRYLTKLMKLHFFLHSSDAACFPWLYFTANEMLDVILSRRSFLYFSYFIFLYRARHFDLTMYTCSTRLKVQLFF